MTNKPTKETAVKILDLLQHGLTSGLGTPEPGKMCVEAAVCYAMGLPHSDEPMCVSPAVRAFKIGLNDAPWSSNEARANGLRKLAVAQLGSESIDDKLFAESVALGAVQKIVPVALRATAKLHPDTFHKAAMENAAVACETTTNTDAAGAAARAARAAADAARAAYAADAARAAYAAADATRAAYAATYAADATYAAARAAARAADAAARAADAARAARAARAAARAARAAYAADAARAAYAADAAARDEVLTLCAEIGLQALITCGSPGCEFLTLCD